MGCKLESDSNISWSAFNQDIACIYCHVIQLQFQTLLQDILEEYLSIECKSQTQERLTSKQSFLC